MSTFAIGPRTIVMDIGAPILVSSCSSEAVEAAANFTSLAMYASLNKIETSSTEANLLSVAKRRLIAS
jgi:hypothetical protein